MKTNLIILIVILAVIVVAGGVYIYTQKDNSPLPENEEPAEEMGCVKEGEQVNDDENPASKSCCVGLVKVESVDEFSEGAICKASGSIPSYQPFRCTACGNGVCGKGENKCNCPSDCQ